MTNHPLDDNDVANRLRAIRDSITAKTARRKKVDNQGHTQEPSVTYQYDERGMFIGKATSNGQEPA